MSLNILFINSISIYGGGEVWMITAAKELIKRGHNLSIICKPDSQLKIFAEKNNISVIPLKIQGDLDPSTIKKLIRIIHEKKTDIILANTGKELRLSGVSAKLAGRGKVIARHGIDYPLKNKFRYKVTYNYLTDIIIANSEATKKTLLKNAPWLNPQRIKVIYNGINADNYDTKNSKDLRNELNIPHNVPLIGFTGRLSVQKGIKYLLDAFLLLKEKINAHLLITGDGELEEEINSFINKNKLNDSVHLTGFREDINNVMRTIDLLVLPSLWEGFGIVLIEAMAAGKPCITTQISSMPEIVVDNVTGIIVPPANHKSLADTMFKILWDKETAERMGREGLRIVKEKFSLDKMINEYEKIFRNLAEKS